MKSALSTILIVFVIIGCGTAPPQITKRAVPVPVFIDSVDVTIPLQVFAEHKDNILLNTYNDSDSLLFGKALDSLNNVIALIAVDFKNKIARIKIPEKHNTVYVTVTDTVPFPAAATGLETAVSVLPWYLQAVWFAILGILLWFGFKGNLISRLKK